MARLAFGEITIHEIEIAHESAIVEGGTIRRCLATANQGCDRSTAKIVELVTDATDRVAV